VDLQFPKNNIVAWGSGDLNVSSITSSSNTNITYSYTNCSDVSGIEGQIRRLKQQLKDENQSEEDANTKQQKLKLIQSQIVQLEAQIQGINSRKQNQNASDGNAPKQVTLNKYSVTANTIDVEA